MGNHCSPCSLAPGEASSQCPAWRRLATLLSESTKTLTVVREVGLTPTISTFEVVASRCSAVWIFSCICVGSTTRTFVSYVAERRSSTTTRSPRPVHAARVFGDAQDECETTNAHLPPGLLTWVVDNVVGVSSDVVRLVTAVRRDWSSARSSS